MGPEMIVVNKKIGLIGVTFFKIIDVNERKINKCL
jgi:hypothetical protein